MTNARARTASKKAPALVIGCPAVLEDLRSLLPMTMAYRPFDFGHYANRRELRNALQQAVTECSDLAETIILAYGLCHQGVIGLRASTCTVVVPRVDDCIAMVLGSNEAYGRQSRKEPGTYYLTKGWIEMGQTPLAEHERMTARYGKKRADRIQQTLLKSYTRLAFIKTGEGEQKSYRDQACDIAAQCGLQYEEIEARPDLIEKMISGRWDKEFMVVEPGETITLEHFLGPRRQRFQKKPPRKL